MSSENWLWLDWGLWGGLHRRGGRWHITALLTYNLLFNQRPVTGCAINFPTFLSHSHTCSAGENATICVVCYYGEWEQTWLDWSLWGVSPAQRGVKPTCHRVTRVALEKVPRYITAAMASKNWLCCIEAFEGVSKANGGGETSSCGVLTLDLDSAYWSSDFINFFSIVPHCPVSSHQDRG